MISWKALGETLFLIGLLGASKYWFDLIEKKQAPQGLAPKTSPPAGDARTRATRPTSARRPRP